MSKKAIKNYKRKKKKSCKGCSTLALPLAVRQMVCRNCEGNKT
jgi:hypothetical protein